AVSMSCSFPMVQPLCVGCRETRMVAPLKCGTLDWTAHLVHPQSLLKLTSRVQVAFPEWPVSAMKCISPGRNSENLRECAWQRRTSALSSELPLTNLSEQSDMLEE